MLKLHWPKLEAHWWISRGLAPLLEKDPDVSKLHLFERNNWTEKGFWVRKIRMLRDMRSQRYDYVIDLQGLARSGATGWLANGNTYIGLEDVREGAHGYYDVCIPRPSAGTHALDWYLKVVEYLGAPRNWNFQWLPARPAVSQSLQRDFSFCPEKVITFVPGGRWENKRWPAAYFSALAKHLTQSFPDHKIAIIGAWNEGALANEISEAVPGYAVNLAGRTSFSEMTEVLRLSRIVITNDSGPMHIAAALGKPVLAFFGPTDPRRTGAYGQLRNSLRIELPCSPCLSDRCRWTTYMQCLRDIVPDEAIVRVDQIMRKSETLFRD